MILYQCFFQFNSEFLRDEAAEFLNGLTGFTVKSVGMTMLWNDSFEVAIYLWMKVLGRPCYSIMSMGSSTLLIARINMYINE